MAKIVSKLIRAQIALLNPIIKRLDLPAQRALQDALGQLGAAAKVKDVLYEDEPGLNALWALPKACEPARAILYLHGGAYVAGSLAYAKSFGGVLAEQMSWTTLCLGYRLAPENPWPAALEDALAAYERMLDSYLPENIAFVGESAGGGLCFCLALKCRELGLPMPACIVAVSPWTDLTLSGKACQDELILHCDTLIDNAKAYAGENLENPLVSPVFGDLTGLPDSLIFAGDMELLKDDAVRMAQRLTDAGCRCDLQLEEGMWHAYVLYGVPEAKKAVQCIKEYLAQMTARGKNNGMPERDTSI
jgi:acetyl esterase/lipase